MPNFQIPYTTPANYTYDSDKIEITGGVARLKLQNSLQSFIEDFADDTDFTYDSNLAEFVDGKVQQKWQNNDYVARAKWTNNQKDLLWGIGNSLTCTLSGNASTHADYLDLSSGGYITGNADANNFSSDNGAVGIEWIPNYNGSPASRQYIYWESKSSGEKHNGIGLYHDINGYLYFEAFDSSGNYIGQSSIQLLNAVSGQSYKWQINWNSSYTYIYLRIGSGTFSKIKTIFSISARATDIGIFRIGRSTVSYASNFYTRNFYRKNTLITTASTTSVPTLNDYAYFSNNVTLPEMEHTYAGNLTTIDSFVTVESGNPRYTFQIGRSGNYLYWNGSAWVISDGSYAQANDSTTFNAHIDELDVEGDTYIQFKIHFDNLNIQSYVDTLTVNLYMDTGYPTSKPSIYATVGNGIADIEEWTSFVEILGRNNEGSVVYQLSDDEVTWKYWNGSIWDIAGTNNYNSATIVDAHILNFDASADKIYIKAIFISNGEQQVELDLNEVGYVVNTAPSVYAGTNKLVVYNVATTPFSDCLFFDEETNIVKAEWKEEGGAYSEISQGAYSTLLEAVQAFEYTPTYSGNKTLYLKITDSYDASIEDTLTVNVNQVIVTINVKDISGNHLSNFTWNAGDSSESSIQNSPFSFTYDIGSWIATISKNRFDSISESTNISISTTELTYTLRRETLIDDLILNITMADFLTLGDTFNMDCKLNTALTNYKIRCHISDDKGNFIKLATANSGGSDDEIEILNASTGEFIITCAKDLTDNFSRKITIEIEVENADGQVRTLFKKKFEFLTENLDWITP